MNKEGKKKIQLKELYLVIFSIFFVFFLLAVIDRMIEIPLGSHLQKNIALIFPPHSQEEFVSTDFHYKVVCNSVGIRDDREVNIPKNEDIYRIVVLGDSYTYGWGVDIEDTWVRQLETLIKVNGKKVEILNLGKPGGDPLSYLQLAETAIPLLEPDLVLLALLQGDDLLATCGAFHANKQENIIFTLLHCFYPNITQKVERYFVQKYLIKQSEQIPPLSNSAEKNQESARNSAKEILAQLNEKEKERFNKLDNQIRSAFLDGLINPFLISVAIKYPDITVKPLEDSSNPAIAPCIENLKRILREIDMISKRSGAQIVLISVPQGFYVNRHAWENMKRLQFEVLPEMLTSHQIDEHYILAGQQIHLPCIVITDEFRSRKEDPDLFFPIDGHPTPQGHRLLAEALARQLQNWLDENINNH